MRVEAGVVEVWEIALDDPGLQKLESTLGPDETARADRFLHAVHRARFIARRGALRLLLAKRLGCEAREVGFGYGPKGKPFLPGGELELNISHSGERALIALAARPIGVDIERVRPMKDALDIAKRFFSAPESERLRAERDTERDQTFFDIWTKKEAFVKAVGEGLSRPLDSFSVPEGGEGCARIAANDGVAAEWEFRRVEVADGFAGALAMEAPVPPVACRSWAEALAGEC